MFPIPNPLSWSSKIRRLLRDKVRAIGSHLPHPFLGKGLLQLMQTESLIWSLCRAEMNELSTTRKECQSFTANSLQLVTKQMLKNTEWHGAVKQTSNVSSGLKRWNWSHRTNKVIYWTHHLELLHWQHLSHEGDVRFYPKCLANISQQVSDVKLE